MDRFVKMLIIAWIIVAFCWGVFAGIHIAKGQDLDPRYKCIEHPFWRSCDPQLQKDKKEIISIINQACQMNKTLCFFGDNVK